MRDECDCLSEMAYGRVQEVEWAGGRGCCRVGSGLGGWSK